METIINLNQEKEILDIDIEMVQKRTGSTTEENTTVINDSSFGRK